MDVNSMSGCELCVVYANDQDVPRDGHSMGEIIARTDGVLEGYWRQPEATTEVLRGGWFHTGDMATWNKEGYILIVDRKKDIIVSGGENVSSLEVEKVLLSHPAVLEAAVLPVPDATWGEVPKALVVLKPGARANERSEEHTSELQSLTNLVCRLLLEKKKKKKRRRNNRQ